MAYFVPPGLEDLPLVVKIIGLLIAIPVAIRIAFFLLSVAGLLPLVAVHLLGLVFLLPELGIRLVGLPLLLPKLALNLLKLPLMLPGFLLTLVGLVASIPSLVLILLGGLIGVLKLRNFSKGLQENAVTGGLAALRKGLGNNPLTKGMAAIQGALAPNKLTKGLDAAYGGVVNTAFTRAMRKRRRRFLETPFAKSMGIPRKLIEVPRTIYREGMNTVLGAIFSRVGPVLKWVVLAALAAGALYLTYQAPLLVLFVLIAWFLTWRVIPWLYVRILRLLGFRAQMTPITVRRVARFKRIKRGYYSFIGITTLFVASLFLEMMVNDKALAISYNGKLAFPAVNEWLDKALFFTDISSYEAASDFGQLGQSPVDYRAFERHSEDPSSLRKEIDAARKQLAVDAAAYKAKGPPEPDAKKYQVKRWERDGKRLKKRAAELDQRDKSHEVFARGDAWCVMPIYPYSTKVRHEFDKNPPNPPDPSLGIPLGTDTSGRDVLVLMTYGFRISLFFALIVAAIGYTIGIIVGGVQGYFGGWVDIVSQRIVEIWGSIPFLLTIMIIASLIQPTLGLLVVLLVVFRSWLGITYYIRGEFYREKGKDYVQAAIGAGVSDWKIITRHILPNSLVPVVTFAPFGIVAYVGTLVSLDYLGFGLPPGTPSWGALLRQGLENVQYYPHLAVVPTAALAITLFAVVMIGEAVREAFDPKVFSRLR